MTRRRAVLGALSAVVASVVVTLAAGGGVAAESNTNLRAATVSPALLDQLKANPTGGVAAIVTTWNRDGLADVTSVVQGTKLRILPMVLTKSLTLAQLQDLQKSPVVRSVWHNEKFDLYMEDSTWITKARYVWPSSNGSGGPQGFGVTGMGVELAMIDTGFDGQHEDGDNLIEFCETLQAATSDRSSVICSPWDPSFNPAPAGPCGVVAALTPSGIFRPCGPFAAGTARGDSRDEDVSHGSHVGGTILGPGHASGGTAFRHSTTGIAPHAKFRAYSANVASSLLSTEILASYDDMTFKKEEGYSEVVAVNNSWGGSGGSDYNTEDPIHVAIERAWRAGILSVFAAGNSGPEHNTLSHQCVSPFVACVAATTKPDSIVAFSSRGRPSQPQDTNRDGQINASDIPPDNHDWRLGQAHKLGRYRPTLAAPGVNINSIKAIGLNIGDPLAATCREDELINNDTKANCYVQASGTSMATPHVTGAVGLIVQAFRRGHDGDTPTPNQIIDILERSANTSKLPAWESEEQGAGRLDVYEAVKFARSYPNGLRRPNLGYPTPPYVANEHPGSPMSVLPGEDDMGCTGVGSWTTKSLDFGFLEPFPQPPVPTPSGTYGQHFIDVPAKVDRLRITVTWPKHTTANLYARLWRPGVQPDSDTATPDYVNPVTGNVQRTPAYHQSRAWPDQEATGLPVGLPPTYRLVDVRAPEESNPAEGSPGIDSTLPQGQWILRVYHRAGGSPALCGATDEEPPQAPRTAFEYNLKIEVGRVTHRPNVRIDSPTNPNTTGRFVEIRGKAGYPPHAQDPPPIGNTGHSWEGITNWDVPGSGGMGSTSPHEEPDPNNPRPKLYFHGNLHDAGDPREEGCTGDGRADLIACSGPMLLSSSDLFSGAAATWKGTPAEWAADGANDRTIFDPNWVWCLAVGPSCPTTETPAPGAKTVGGPMTVEWWASCGPLCIAGGPDWWIRLWGDGALKVEARVAAGPALPNVPERLVATVQVPTFTASQRITLQIEPVFLVDQYLPFLIYYDSGNPCVATATGSCDSLVKMPVGPSGGGGGGGPGPAPQNVRVTDLPHQSAYPGATTSPALRVAWDPQGGVSRYEVYRSTNPASLGTRVHNGTGTECVSPEAPTPNSPPGHDRAGRCFTDTGVSLRTTYYYRVFSVTGSQRSLQSEIAYGTPTRYDRQVKLKVDRLHGPKYWEYALVPPSPNPTLDDSGLSWSFLWDTLELSPGEYDLAARSFTQGIGSTKASRTLNNDDDTDPDPDPGPGCPDDDDGDGDDDGDDGDSDDDGDDDDDDCEDDDDDEEEDDD